MALQSPPKESIHFCRAEYSKLRGTRWKVGGMPNPPLIWSKLGQASFWPTQEWVWCTPYFSSSAPQFWVIGFAASVYFLALETPIFLKFVFTLFGLMKGDQGKEKWAYVASVPYTRKMRYKNGKTFLQDKTSWWTIHFTEKNVLF